MIGSRIPSMYDPTAPGAVSARDPSVSAPIAEQVQAARGNGFFDRLGSLLKQPGMSGALLRSAGATFDGGIGAGIRAGTNHMEQQQQVEAAAQQNAIQNLFRQQQIDQGQQSIDQTGQYQTGQLGLGVARAEEDVAARRSRDTLTARGQDITTRGQNIGLQDNREGRRVQLYGIDANNAASVAREQMGNETTRYVADRGADSRETVATTRGAGIGSKAPRPASAAMQKQAVVLPANATAADLEAGKIYRTARGLGQWDGAKFVPVN